MGAGLELVDLECQAVEKKVNRKAQVHKEAVKKPITLSTKESAHVLLWIALADLGGFVYAFFSLRRLLVSSSGSSVASCR
jgi:hypothetical protein